jgi:hypothetical protein
MSKRRAAGHRVRTDVLPGFQVAAVTVPLIYGPVIGLAVAAVLVLGGAYLTLPRAQVTSALLQEAFVAVAFAGIVVGGLSSAVFGYPVARAMQRRGAVSPLLFAAMGLAGGLAALGVWQLLVTRGLVFQPYFAPWRLAFPIYGVLYALLFRWRAGKRPLRR